MCFLVSGPQVCAGASTRGKPLRALVIGQTRDQTDVMTDDDFEKNRRDIDNTSEPKSSVEKRFPRFTRTIGRVGLGALLTGAGIGHLTTLREEFQAQVPDWVPVDQDVVVVASGIVEIGLGAALVLAPRSMRPAVGTTTAAFFIAVFPGNIAQYVEGTDAFGLNSDQSRFIRLFFQPVLGAWALWSTDAWSWLRDKFKRQECGPQKP